MTTTVEGSGTQSATVTTEHTLHQNSGAKVFVLVVDTTNMQAGDTVTLKVYTKTLTGSSQSVCFMAVYTGPQSDEPIKMSPPLAASGFTNGYKATLTQNYGTSRNFDWAVLSV